MKSISIDIESFSGVNLQKSGIYRYAESNDFEILLFGYSVDGGDIKVVDLARGETIPDEIINALTDDAIQKWAFNAQFERICLSRFLGMETGQYLESTSWHCTMVWSATLGLPLSLEGVGAVLGLEKQKLSEGKNLIRYFCVPCATTKINGGRTRNLPEHDADKWLQFKSYNMRDVEVELAIQQKLSKFQVPDAIWNEYHLDQEINDRGIGVDMTFVKQAIAIDDYSNKKLTALMQEATNIENPNSVLQMKNWLAENGLETDTLGKKAVAEMLKTAPEPLSEVLELRQQLAKSSVKKYTAMQNVVCSDGRLRGMFSFYGANRTGRWCLTGDHEILTSSGWSRIDSLFNGRPIIAVYNLLNGNINFEKSKIIQFGYTGDMYEWDDKRISQLSTPEHRNPITDIYGNTSLKYIAEISGKSDLPVCGCYSSTKERKFSDDELRLLVAYQADGIWAGGKRRGLSFRFSKQRKIERMREILKRLNYYYKENKHSDGATCFIVPYGEYNTAIKTKQFNWWLINENATVFFEELGYWDGSFITDNSIQYVTTNKRNAEIVATFAHLSNRAATINAREPQKYNHSYAYYVEIWSNIRKAGVNIKSSPQKKEGFDGTVYCAETSTGCFLVRRNDKIWVSGNSSKTINIQNLPQNHMPDLEQARGLVCSGNFDALDLLYDSVPDVLSELIRTAFVPQSNRKFIVADFAAIEARVIAWLAGEKWRLNVFAKGGDIYCSSASRMFHVPVEKNGTNGHLRQKGKISELALGYGGSVGALKAMGALEMGIAEEELQPLVKAWRDSNPNITKLWWDVDRAVKTCFKQRTKTQTHGIKFIYQSGMLFIVLPSGRRLTYVKPRMGVNMFGGEAVTYEGVGGTKKWERIESYGPKFVENIVQAISRDILCYAMQALKDYSIVAHVHDEIIIEADMEISLTSICEQMARTPTWAKGLLLSADGYECQFYQKG